MSNLEKAVELIGSYFDAHIPHNEANYGADEELAQALKDTGLLAPDLPEPELYGELAEFGDEEVFAARGTSKVRIYIDDARMSSESARELALMLLAAANYAETEHPS